MLLECPFFIILVFYNDKRTKNIALNLQRSVSFKIKHIDNILK